MANIFAIQRPIFQPAMRIISAITNAFPAEVTTTFAHNYETGYIIRLVVPSLYGMQQVNQLYAEIVVTGAATFLFAIDTTSFDVFLVPDPLPQDYDLPQTIPIGENNSMLTGATQNVLPYS